MTHTIYRAMIALGLVAPLTLTPALAEQHTAATDDAEASQETQSPQGGDMLVVTVGDTEITAADVQAALEAFPQQVRQTQPAEMLVPVAVQQLVLRELVLRAAMDENLGEDEEVQRIVDENAQRTRDDAMVQVYIQRELDEAVTDEAVQETYDRLAENSETEIPPLEDVRAQIEQQLRQERLNEVGTSLQETVEIVYYGPDGEPMTADASAPGAESGSVADNEPMNQEVTDAPETDGEYGDDGEAATQN